MWIGSSPYISLSPVVAYGFVSLKLDLAYLCVCRTAPFHSWKNPVKKIMSVVNLGLQSLGLIRQ